MFAFCCIAWEYFWVAVSIKISLSLIPVKILNCSDIATIVWFLSLFSSSAKNLCLVVVPSKACCFESLATFSNPFRIPVIIQYLDSPATVSSTTYTVYFRTNTVGTVALNQDSSLSVITLQEIAA